MQGHLVLGGFFFLAFTRSLSISILCRQISTQKGSSRKTALSAGKCISEKRLEWSSEACNTTGLRDHVDPTSKQRRTLLVWGLAGGNDWESQMWEELPGGGGNLGLWGGRLNLGVHGWNLPSQWALCLLTRARETEQHSWPSARSCGKVPSNESIASARKAYGCQQHR